MHAPEANRWFCYVALAGALHGSALLIRGSKPSDVASAKRVVDALDPIELGLNQDPPAVLPAPEPAGASSEPRPDPRLDARDSRARPSTPTRLVSHPPPARPNRVEPSEPREAAAAPEPFATDLLASDNADARDEVRPRAARRQLLADEAQTRPHDALEAAQQQSRFGGSGPGLSGGSGGLGRGAGVVARRFAFGGPSGAFRADVCFIEATVRFLNDITTCAPVMTFYTDVLNVTPRRFDHGFPGLGRRTEWFAIKYSGKFRVQAEDSYTFRLVSDDGSRLEIDGHQVLDNDGQHQPTAVSSNVRLAAGVHDFFVFYYQGPPDFVALQLFVKRFAHDEQLFGPLL